ncbi:thiol:disulfide interchange protein DsbA/DsbL [Dyella silvatica]|uniref:thiol:disulfide interchange protein DsbA/DsbL n=1 Tax=Dyella silvatica TaxID=2992128 RepID=UPI0022505F53|nr:thiol:disulfide interchange protein DsbA/DsbL [Dyella silvatica]
MLKRLPFLCAALFTLAACNHSSDNGSSAATQPPAASTAPAVPAAASTAAPAPAASTPAPASTAAVTPVPATPAPAETPHAPAAAFVDNGKWVAGKQYEVIEPAQSKLTSSNKIEVVEVFSYGCPACNQFHATANDLAKSLPANAVMAYLPVSFNPAENFPMFQRAFYAAEALGVADKANDAMYDAVWKTSELTSYKPGGQSLKPASALPTLDDAAKVYAKFGADPKEFAAVANSFAVNTKIKRADDLVKAYGVQQTPTMIVNGKYRFTVGSAGGYGEAIELANWLVAKEAAGK